MGLGKAGIWRIMRIWSYADTLVSSCLLFIAMEYGGPVMIHVRSVQRTDVVVHGIHVFAVLMACLPLLPKSIYDSILLSQDVQSYLD